jgi:flavin reductase (DIM6/NTAB) family NADH-FMN oxidoreductase RutF
LSPLKSRPTTLIISRQIGKQNIIAVAWVAPQDFDPPKITIVIDKNTYTRERVEASGGFAINVPCLAQMDTLHIVGTSTGRDLKESDKFALYHLHSFPAKETAAPLLKGCVAWLECKVIPERHCQDAYDLFVAEMVAAYADKRVFHKVKMDSLAGTLKVTPIYAASTTWQAALFLPRVSLYRLWSRAF